MASIKEIIDKERLRKDIPSARVVHLYLEGTFYRAYEWSAWLCNSRIHEFKATHRSFKNIDGTVVLIGFPPASLPKFVPEGAELITVSDKETDIVLSDSVIPENYDINLMVSDFSEWKNSIPVQQKENHLKASKQNPAAEVSSSDQITNPGLKTSGILQQILAFNVNERTPFECMKFVSDLREKVISML